MNCLSHNNCQIEEWKSISGYVGLYEVSNLGNVRNVKTGHVLKTNRKKTGYFEVCLAYGKKKTFLLHRLVASAFVENPNNLSVVNHKDEDKSNNRASNLEWCTTLYNINYGNGALQKNCPVRQLDIDENIIRDWESMKAASEALGIHYQTISSVCRGKGHTAGGYKWVRLGRARVCGKPKKGTGKRSLQSIKEKAWIQQH